MAKAYTDAELQAACERVYAAVDLEVLKNRCQQSKKSLFVDLGGKMHGTKQERHAFLDRKSRILAVAHLDTVQSDSTFGYISYPDETLVFNPRLDDRLGAYTLLDLLPALGIMVDTLFTDNEERGQTTAANFRTQKKYNWIVSFDRRGEDVVTYQYTWDAVLRDYFTVGHGSFSCIGKLDTLGCQAMNIGVGYQNEHSKRAFFIFEEYLRQIARFVLFYEKYSTTKFPYEARRVVCGRSYYDSRKPESQQPPQSKLGFVREKIAEHNGGLPLACRSSKLELMANNPEAIAFCDFCWKDLAYNDMHSISEYVLWSGMCNTCGFITEITGPITPRVG